MKKTGTKYNMKMNYDDKNKRQEYNAPKKEWAAETGAHG